MADAVRWFLFFVRYIRMVTAVLARAPNMILLQLSGLSAAQGGMASLSSSLL